MFSLNFMQYFFGDVKEKIVGPEKTLQDQLILGVTGPTDIVTFCVSVEPCNTSKKSQAHQ